MDGTLILVSLIVLVALVFDYINGFHDAANSVATIVATRVLTPFQAVLWAAFFNFLAAVPLLFWDEAGVAKTVGKGMVKIELVTEYVILAGLLGAIAWNLFTWFYGIPSSSSHALIGGYAGAAMAKMAATEGAQQVIDAALQMWGGLGVTRGQPVESLYREIRALRIYEGATEVQQLIIARELLKSWEKLQ